MSSSASSFQSAWTAGENQAPVTSIWHMTWKQFRRHRLSMLGLFMLAFFVLAAVLAPLLPQDPITVDLETNRLESPSAEHWFGTDHLGRDVFTRTMHGARISLSIGFLATGLAIGLGTIYGAIAGFYGGRLDDVLMRFIDLLFSLPILFLLIIMQSLVETPSIYNVMLVLALTSWMSPARLVRGEILKEREMEYVQASRALGASTRWIILRHLLPNVIGPVIVMATLRVGRVIILESALSYLGFGVQPPDPSWGSMLAQAREYLNTGIWIAIFPGLFLSLTVLAFNFVGDGLAAAMNPHERK